MPSSDGGGGVRGMGPPWVTLSIVASAALALIAPLASTGAPPTQVRTLDGSGNNLGHPSWGQAGTEYVRLAEPNYADGMSQMTAGPRPRYVSNRIFNDVG